MNHTYTLNNLGFADPRIVQPGRQWTVTVSEPRRLVVEGVTLQLVPGQPDLPVGQQVKVWLSRFFHCESVDYIEHQNQLQAEQIKAQEHHEDEVRQDARATIINRAKALIDEQPSASDIKDHLETLAEQSQKYRQLYKANWLAEPGSDQKQISNDAVIYLSAIREATAVLADYLGARIRQMGWLGRKAVAMHPHEGGNSGFYAPGHTHFQLMMTLEKGRLKRQRLDALCKPYSKFKDLHGDPQQSPDLANIDCPKCLKRMADLAF